MAQDTHTPIPPGLEDLAVPITELHPYPGNARRGDLPLLMESLQAHGQYRPVVANRRTGHVLAGNNVLAAATALGWDRLAATWVDVDDAQARKIVLLDNRANDLAGYDPAAHAALLDAILGDTAGTGYTDADIADAAAAAYEPVQLTDVDEIIHPPRTETVSRPGDLWHLGPHRLVVGDAADPAAWAQLLAPTGTQPATEKVDLLLTDPPYGISYDGSVHQPRVGITGDDLRGAGIHNLLQAALGHARRAMHPGAPFYIFAPSAAAQLEFRTGTAAAGLEVRQEIVWVKNTIVMGRSDYQPKHESILAGNAPDPDEDQAEPHEVALYGWTDGAGHRWNGGRKQTTVWEFPKPSRSKLHPTMKPVAMLEKAIRNSTGPMGIVADPFTGSGSTLIACHATLRFARLIELDARYADATLARWQSHTGDKPTRNGQPYTFEQP